MTPTTTTAKDQRGHQLQNTMREQRQVLFTPQKIVRQLSTHTSKQLSIDSLAILLHSAEPAQGILEPPKLGKNRLQM